MNSTVERTREIVTRLYERNLEFLCSWFHGGGRIKLDELGRINWQCSKCGRWSDSPVAIYKKAGTNERLI